jgi:hypothetical protein
MVTKYIPVIMGMKLSIGLIGETYSFFTKNTSCQCLICTVFLNLRRSITIPQAYMAKWTKKHFGVEILLKTVFEQRASNMTPAQAIIWGSRKKRWVFKKEF